ncbi:4Fe-4S dicluster domain-containing protein [Rhodovibrio salinarum]|uniref:4Fe-4S dicluster domain-containing protein n=1 Tax=Rhodovibrio salinarum TaxID=1087 RepID=UPI000484CF08|nr:4Fe-4S dicluster domain-containing protein [Rhodovibrio salinarum]
MSVYRELADALEGHGLLLRGGFQAAPDDRLPEGSGTVLMVGNAGPALWQVFTQAPEATDGQPDGLDRWTRRVMHEFATAFGARPVLPFEGPPYVPFQRWAQRAEAVAPSPIGILIHPDYGLWHAYRGALVFAQALDLPPADKRGRPCDNCPDAPCLNTCPVGAFTPDGYDVHACATHIGQLDGRECVDGGCLARRACPVGTSYQYTPAQASWHMQGFLGATGSG